MKKVLIIEDEEAIRMALEDDFIIEGYEVDSADSGTEGLQKAMGGKFDIILLDIMLPGINGFDICKNLRYQGNRTPIIMLTAKGQEIDKVLGLELGADDYVTKPFSPRELHARVRAILRRVENEISTSRSDIISAFDLYLDVGKRELKKNGKSIDLTLYEFELLKFLMENLGKVVSRDELLDKVWGEDVFVGPRTIDTHIGNLRKKIEPDLSSPKYISSIRGIGYRFGS